LAHIQRQAHEMHAQRGFPFSLPTAGMHVRHGDKHIDGFIEHSLNEELEMVRSSPDCVIRNDQGDCFVSVNISDYHYTATVLSRVIQGHAVLLKLEDISKFNHSTDNKEISVDVRPVLHALKQQAMHANITEENHSNHSLLLQSYVIPLSIFVASDDLAVIRSAEKRGFLVDSAGISQQTAITGMLTTLLAHPELGFNATLEIVSDIFFLSQCSTLLGTASSQVFRIAVALSNVTGTLHEARISDKHQVERVKQLSRKYAVPFPENF
jgi:hypothetical protein